MVLGLLDYTNLLHLVVGGQVQPIVRQREVGGGGGAPQAHQGRVVHARRLLLVVIKAQVDVLAAGDADASLPAPCTRTALH